MVTLYDIENYPNYCCFIFIDLNLDNNILNLFIDADIRNNAKDIKKYLNMLPIYKFRIFKDENREINEIPELVTFFREHKILIGFNNLNYDDELVDTTLIYLQKASTEDVLRVLNSTGNNIINSPESYTKVRFGSPRAKQYVKPYRSLDLMVLLYLNTLKKSLKQTMINVCWYKIQDLPISPNSIIKYEQLDEIELYCVNDILGSRAIYLRNIEEFRLRIASSEEYNEDLWNTARSTLGDKVFLSNYLNESGLTKYQFFNISPIDRRVIRFSELIDENISFKTPILIDLLYQLKQTIIKVGQTSTSTKYSYVDMLGRVQEVSILTKTKGFEKGFILNNNKFNMKLGGLHTEDKPKIITGKGEWYIIDVDGTSFYPRIITNLKLYPEQLDKTSFLKTILKMTKDRTDAKTLSNTVIDILLKTKYNQKADILKISINNLFGKLLFAFGRLYDLKAGYSVTLNGQLYLLSLVEDLIDPINENLIIPISANTDGIMSLVHKSKLDDYLAICSKWSNRYNIPVEYSYFTKIVRTSISDYIALKGKGLEYVFPKEHIDIFNEKNIIGKLKGQFNPFLSYDVTRGYDMPIVGFAHLNYFINGIAIENTIRNCQDILMFCKAQKVGSGYTPTSITIEEDEIISEALSKTVRYYISNSGTVIVKQKGGKQISMVAKEYCRLMNKLPVHKNMEQYDINYLYYIRKANEIIYSVNGILTKQLKKSSDNGMFN